MRSVRSPVRSRTLIDSRGAPAVQCELVYSEESMAKGRRNIAAAEHKLEGFAEDLGRMLGHARTKAEGWLGQRRAIVKNLTELRDEASKLLTQLGHDAVIAGRKGRRRPGLQWIV